MFHYVTPIQNNFKTCCLKLILLRTISYDSRINIQRYISFIPGVINITSPRSYSQSSALNIETYKENPNINDYTYRTHNCGELRLSDVGKNVSLCGWVQYLRMSKFLLLRDSYGLTQCIAVHPDINFNSLPLETVIKINGIVLARPKGMANKDMPTGEIEVVIENIEILNVADNLPFNLRNYQKPKEQLRLQHRYIDLRYPEMQNNLRQRSTLLHNMRKFLIEKKAFVEVETPTLFCQTPGGAREFVVPTHHAGLFYSLVQSPQQFKQMLMVGGIDRYFQVARCYRDESTRPDRQPEFTQLDIEMSFTNLDGVLTMVEELFYESYLKPMKQSPFKRMTYRNVLESYGTDKPDLSYNMKFINIKHLFSNKDNPHFGAYALPYTKELGRLTAKSKESIKDLSKRYRNVNIVLNDRFNKEFGVDLSHQIEDAVCKTNLAIIAMGDNDESCLCLGEIRCLIASLLKSQNLLEQKSDTLQPLWVVDFPLFLKGQDENLETCHHPFTAPHPEDLHLLDKRPLEVRSLAYDLVFNGNEVAGGSIRIHNADLQDKILQMLNIDGHNLRHFLDALRSGCPPHGGIALGVDRIVALMCNTDSIRDVIAFPKSHEGKDPLSGAPNNIRDDDKRYYHIT